MERRMVIIYVSLYIFICQRGRFVLCEGNATDSNRDGKHQNTSSDNVSSKIESGDSMAGDNKTLADTPFQQRLLKKILGTGVQSLPAYTNSPRINVYMSMQLMRIDEVSEKGQAVTAKIISRQEWKNKALRWKPDEYGNLTEILISRENIWTPKIHLFNGARRKSIDREASEIRDHLMVTVDHEGKCTLTFTDFYKSTCEIDVTFFPFDEQTCRFEFGSWSFDERYLRLKVKNSDALGDRSEYENNGEWEMDHGVLIEQRVKYRLNDRHHSIVALKIHVKRKYFFYMMNLVIPCALIACMIFLVFLLPPKSGERISLGITVLLSMAIFQELSSEKLPSSSDTFPLLGIYYTVSIFEIGMAMALNCLVLNFYHRNQRMSPIIRKILLGKLAKLLRVEITQRKHSSELQHQESFSEFDSSFAKAIGPNSINLATISHMGNDKDTEKPTLSRMSSMRGSLRERKNHEDDAEEATVRSKSPLISRKALSLTDGGAIGNGIIGKDNVESKRNGEEWKDAAKVLDRLLLAISIVIGVVSASAIFLQSKRFRNMFFPGDGSW